MQMMISDYLNISIEVSIEATYAVWNTTAHKIQIDKIIAFWLICVYILVIILSFQLSQTGR